MCVFSLSWIDWILSKIPRRHAQPLIRASESGIPETICGRCDAYKPPRSHHCRICDRQRLENGCGLSRGLVKLLQKALSPNLRLDTRPSIRVGNRCIVRMDHHCPWMNNCIGATLGAWFKVWILKTGEFGVSSQRSRRGDAFRLSRPPRSPKSDREKGVPFEKALRSSVPVLTHDTSQSPLSAPYSPLVETQRGPFFLRPL